MDVRDFIRRAELEDDVIEALRLGFHRLLHHGLDLKQALQEFCVY